jgi:hypothetical protein
MIDFLFTKHRSRCRKALSTHAYVPQRRLLVGALRHLVAERAARWESCRVSRSKHRSEVSVTDHALVCFTTSLSGRKSLVDGSAEAFFQRKLKDNIQRAARRGRAEMGQMQFSPE